MAVPFFDWETCASAPLCSGLVPSSGVENDASAAFYGQDWSGRTSPTTDKAQTIYTLKGTAGLGEVCFILK